MHLKKEATLLAITISMTTGFFLLPRNQQWAAAIYEYWRALPYQFQHMKEEDRMEYRLGNDYRISKQIAGLFIKKRSFDTLLVLVPPTNYFKARGVAYHVPEPAVFYYYTGLKTVWANSGEAMKADWYLRLSGKRLVMERVTDRKQLQDTIQMFRTFGVSL